MCCFCQHFKTATFEELLPQNVWIFLLKNYWNNWIIIIIKIIFVDQLVNSAVIDFLFLYKLYEIPKDGYIQYTSAI